MNNHIVLSSQTVINPCFFSSFGFYNLGSHVSCCSPLIRLFTPGGIRLQPKDPTAARRLQSFALAAPICPFAAFGEPSPKFRGIF